MRILPGRSSLQILVNWGMLGSKGNLVFRAWTSALLVGFILVCKCPIQSLQVAPACPMHWVEVQGKNWASVTGAVMDWSATAPCVVCIVDSRLDFAAYLVAANQASSASVVRQDDGPTMSLLGVLFSVHVPKSRRLFLSTFGFLSYPSRLPAYSPFWCSGCVLRR